MSSRPSEHGRTARALSKQATARQVMAAAGELFTARGYHETTIRDIAAHAGLSVGSVMAVGDKQELFVKVFDGIIGDVHAARSEASASSGDRLGIGGRIASLVEPFITLFMGRLDLSREYGAILMSGAHDSLLFSALADALLREIVAVGLENGHSEPEAQAAAKTVYFSYLGILFAAAARGGTPDPHPHDELVSVLEYVFSRRN